MEDLIRRLSSLREFSTENLLHLVDILLVAYLVYRVLALVRGKRAWRILGGIVTFVAALFLSDYLQLKTLHWVLEKATLLAPVAVVLLLLPELRQTLEGFARLGLWPERLPGSSNPTPAAHTIEEIVAGVAELAAGRVGALIVLERGPELSEIADNGVSIQARVSAPLLISIFFEGNPLHDGAVLVRGDQIVAAACRLPLSENPSVDPQAHMRHRAGVGITEQADCIAIVVSEERGTISASVDGRLMRLASPSELRDLLNAELRGNERKPRNSRRRRREREETRV